MFSATCGEKRTVMIDKAVILATGKKIDGRPVALVKVGGSPLVRRTAIAARRAGAREVIVVADDYAEEIARHLEFDSVPLRLASQQELRSQGLGRGERILVLLDNRLYDYRLLQALAEVEPGNARAVVACDSRAQGQDVGAGIYEHELVEELSAAGESEAALAGLNRRLAAAGQALAVEAGDAFWQVIARREDIAAGEDKLLSYIWKPTDGIHARFNKRLAIPLIKLLLRTPATPNMVSVFSIFVSLSAGLCFAAGSYLYVLCGAALSYLSAILDHIDGSLARVSLKESAFGCWLDTICDHIYYLAIGAGIAAGLFRESRNEIYLIMGGLMLIGTVLSFIVLGYQRKKFSGANPSEYVLKIHSKLEQGRENPVFRFARNCYFLARRPVLPYYIFIFSVFKMLPFVLFMVTLGAHLVWSITLASNSLFRATKG